MNLVNIKFEVHYRDVTTHKSEESIESHLKKISITDAKYSARYRIYIDSNLLTERVWYWGNDHYLKENMFVDLDKNSEHTIKLESLFCLDYLTYPIAICMKNIKIPNATILNQSKNNLTFKIA